MLSTENLSRLIEPVICRATASAMYPGLQWRDRWAELVLEKLEVVPGLMQSFRVSAERQFDSLQRCKWVDDQLLAFLRRYPDAQVVELDAGLSTRFHRISNACDWPRFSWVAVDTTDVTDIVSSVFPKLDHHARLAIDGLGADWLGSLSWRCDKPLMIIDDGGLIGGRQMTQVLKQGLLSLSERHMPVHLLVTQKASRIQILTDAPGRPLTLLAQSDAPENGSALLLQRFILSLKHRFLSSQQLRVAHFEIKPSHTREDVEL